MLGLRFSPRIRGDQRIYRIPNRDYRSLASLTRRADQTIDTAADRQTSGLHGSTLLLPQTHAVERLKGLRTSLHASGVFTSDFTVNEFLLRTGRVTAALRCLW
jgi:hypothetical protein